MEDTESQFERVHVLRQTFRPNEPLLAALGTLIATESDGLRPFSIYGSDERVINMSEVGSKELDIQQRTAEKYMETKRNAHFGLEEGVRARLITPNTRGAVILQIVMKPVSIDQFALIQHGLDFVRLGRRSHTLGLEAMQLYMNIPVRQIQPIPRVKECLAEINEILSDDATHRLYQLTPNPYLVGQSMLRQVPKPENKQQCETRAS
ncbi:MAG: hypothetical protein ACOH18_02085 [Candidatus Saccharimonadaceae bacterium]